MHIINTYLPYITACTVTLKRNYLEELNETQALIKAGAKLNKLRTTSATEATKQALQKEKSVSPQLLGTIIKETVCTEIGIQNRELVKNQKLNVELQQQLRKKKELLRKMLKKKEENNKLGNQGNEEGAQNHQVATSRTQYTGGKINVSEQDLKNTSSSFTKR